jgi:hypothetical protein
MLNHDNCYDLFFVTSQFGERTVLIAEWKTNRKNSSRCTLERDGPRAGADVVRRG